MDKLLAKLSESHQVTGMEDNTTSKRAEEMTFNHVNDQLSSGSSLPITPATDAFASTVPTTRPASAAPNDSFVTAEELLRLKLELAHAQNKISRLDQELTQSRLAHSSSGRATPIISPDSEYPTSGGVEPINTRIVGGPTAAFGAPKPMLSRASPGPWQGAEDVRVDGNDSVPNGPGAFQRSRGIWGGGKSVLQSTFPPSTISISDPTMAAPWQPSAGYMDLNVPSYGPPHLMDTYRTDRLAPDHDMMIRPQATRRGGRFDNRFGSAHSFGSGYGSYNLGQSQYDSYGAGPASQTQGNMAMNMYPQYQQQTGGSGLSPHATEFTSSIGAAWKTDVSPP